MKLIINHKQFAVRPANNTSARAFAEILPLTLDMNELNGNEKYAYLGEHLPAEPQCPKEIQAGDIMLFGSNCLVVFYESFRTRYAYSRIGKIQDTEGLREALGKETVKVTIE